MQPQNVIEVKNISKTFKVFIDKGNTIKERILFKKRRQYERRIVLKNVGFTVKKGEAIGIVGHNGCGKSTTLKLLSRILYPDSGTIEIKGRVSSLIELGAGFHPDLSGRENIYINASIFGLEKKEIDKRISDIIAFSELEEFIDNPVRTYSSGMYMRLAFSVAINVDADVLLIDEILAVGDASFQNKCFNKLREIKASGTTIVIVSHSLGQIEQICDRSIWLHEGYIKYEGNPVEVHRAYLQYMGEKSRRIAEKEAQRKQDDINSGLVEENPSLSDKDITDSLSDLEKSSVKADNGLKSVETIQRDKRWGNGIVFFEKVCMLNSCMEESNVFKCGEDITIRMEYKVKSPLRDATVGIGIFRNDMLQCYGTNTRIEKFKKYDLDRDGIIEVNLHEVGLIQGQYLLDVAIEEESGIPVDYYREALRFDIYSDVYDVGVTRINHEWVFK